MRLWRRGGRGFGTGLGILLMMGLFICSLGGWFTLMCGLILNLGLTGHLILLSSEYFSEVALPQDEYDTSVT